MKPWERYAEPAGPWAKYAQPDTQAPEQAAPQMTRGEFLKRELLRSPPVALARGVKDIIDTGAGYLSRLGGADEQARVRAADAAGRAEFDEATKGQVMPQVARMQGNLSVALPALSTLGGAVSSVAPRLGAAIGSGGMTTGAAPVGALAKTADMGIRTLGGAAGGGLTAGMVNPDDAALGAGIGAVAPVAVAAAGRAGQAIGRTLRGAEQTPQMAQAVQGAHDLGLVVPPTQARASLGNRLVEGLAGKLTTAQNASAKNAPKVSQIVARDLGIPEGIPLNAESVGYVKKAAGVLYDAVSSAGQVTPGAGYSKALDNIVAPHLQAARGFPNAKPSPVVQMVDSLRSDSFDAASAVAKIKELRSAADDAFKPGGAGADIGRAAKSAAKALEDALEGHLSAIGEPDLLGQFKQARQLYAKAMSVEKAMDATGAVDARKLAAQLQRGKPLSGDVRKVAESAANFPKAFQQTPQMGSLPQFSPVDAYGAGGLGGMAALFTGNPLAMLAGAGVPVARAVARSSALSPVVQNRLVQPAASTMLPLELLTGARAAPVLMADR